MLIACERCHRQYDVGDLDSGTRFRCACGHLSTVPDRAPRRVEMLHCSTCGGRLPGEGLACEYCEAVPDPADRRTTPCPECYAGMPEDARFCGACGVAIEPSAVVKAITDRVCPRCSGQLMLHEGEDEAYHTCTACDGIWLSRETFERFVDEAKPERDVRYSPAPPATTRARRDGPPERSVRCPVCARVMRRIPFAGYSRVMIDECLAHGFWFDAEELVRIGDFIAEGGMEWARARRRARRRRKRLQRARERERREASDLGLISGILLGMTAGS